MSLFLRAYYLVFTNSDKLSTRIVSHACTNNNYSKIKLVNETNSNT
jgi:hypothetical protein